MCGIVGGVSQRNIVPFLLKGLKRQEYRGYDSAGLAVIGNSGITVRRVKGKVDDLISLVKDCPVNGFTGIAHTRWATHGSPSERNAHPHVSHNRVAVVHNGIIENYEELRQRLMSDGYEFHSDTDTEIIAHMIHQELVKGEDFLQAVKSTVQQLSGAYALGVLDIEHPHRLIAVRCGCPVVVGLGDMENFIASDTIALVPVTSRLIFLEEGDIADVTMEKVVICNATGEFVQREIHETEVDFDYVDKGQYRHYMQKEIFEQPVAIAETLEGRIAKSRVLENIFGANSKKILEEVEHVTIVACGTSYHAGMIARYWLEEHARIPTTVEIASEYRYRHAVVQPNSLFVALSQSGETADTLAALRLAKSQEYLATLSICNVSESSLVRESDFVLMTRAGVEIGVASTKAFSTQLVALLLLTITLARPYHRSDSQEEEWVAQVQSLPKKIEEALSLDAEIREIARQFADKNNALFLGRGSHYPVALEGSLKLKEISYIHAEAYPAGELKHGPLALVDKNMPVIAVAPNDALFEKLKSNLHEVQARGGKLIVFADNSLGFEGNNDIQVLRMPAAECLIAPVVYTIPLQLLAYHVALIKGTDVDQPRNLAKSVTVE